MYLSGIYDSKSQSDTYWIRVITWRNGRREEGSGRCSLNKVINGDMRCVSERRGPGISWVSGII